jgi:hypothetical protein
MLNQKETPIPMVSLGFCHLRNNSRSTEEQVYKNFFSDQFRGWGVEIPHLLYFERKWKDHIYIMFARHTGTEIQVGARSKEGGATYRRDSSGCRLPRYQRAPYHSWPVSPGTEILGDAAQDAGRGDVFRVEDERVPSLPNMPEDIQEINAQLSPVVKEKFTNTTLPISLYKIPSDSVTYTLQESSHSMQLIRIDNGNLKSTLEVKKVIDLNFLCM